METAVRLAGVPTLIRCGRRYGSAGGQHRGRRLRLGIPAIVAIALNVAGCGILKTSAIKSVANTLSEGGTTFTSHDDPDLIEDALPFALTLYESLLASVPRHEPLLTATCKAYTQYAYGFVEAHAEEAQFDDFEASRQLTERALRLTLRARDYCWRGLEVRFSGITARLTIDPNAALAKTRTSHVPLLYWSAASLAAAISLGGIDHPELLIDWPIVRALAERALSLDEAWDRGAIHELLIAVESRGDALGGSEERAREHFARAVDIQQGLSATPYLGLALGVVKANQNRDEFLRLVDQALAVDPERDPDNRLPTLLAQRRARFFREHVDDLFLPAARTAAFTPPDVSAAFAGSEK